MQKIYLLSRFFCKKNSAKSINFNYIGQISKTMYPTNQYTIGNDDLSNYVYYVLRKLLLDYVTIDGVPLFEETNLLPLCEIVKNENGLTYPALLRNDLRGDYLDVLPNDNYAIIGFFYASEYGQSQYANNKVTFNFVCWISQRKFNLLPKTHNINFQIAEICRKALQKMVNYDNLTNLQPVFLKPEEVCRDFTAINVIQYMTCFRIQFDFIF